MEQNHGGMTVTPSISYGDDGQEFVDYGNADVFDHTRNLNAINDFNQNQEDMFSTNEALGETSHSMENEVYLEEQEEVEEYETQELSQTEQMALQESVGGPESYAHMTAWASTVLPPEIVESFNELVDSGDLAEIETVVQALYQRYLESGGDQMEFDIEQPQEVRQPQGVSSDFVDSIHETYGDAYPQLMEWSRNNLSNEQIDLYDHVMEVGTKQQVLDSVNALFQYAQQSQ